MRPEHEEDDATIQEYLESPDNVVGRIQNVFLDHYFGLPDQLSRRYNVQGKLLIRLIFNRTLGSGRSRTEMPRDETGHFARTKDGEFRALNELGVHEKLTALMEGEIKSGRKVDNREPFTFFSCRPPHLSRSQIVACVVILRRG